MKIEGKTVIIVGECDGVYKNDAVVKEFSGKILVAIRVDGCVVVHNLNNGVRPLCYMGGSNSIIVDVGEDVSNSHAEAEVCVTAEDGQILELVFVEVVAIQGME